MLPMLFLFAAAVSSDTVVVRPVEIRDVLANPGMGIQTFQRFNGDELNPGVRWSEEGPVNTLTPLSTRPEFPMSTIAYCRWHWATLEPNQGTVRWEIIDRALQEAHQAGQRLAIRLMPYDPEHALPKWFRNSGARRANSDTAKDGKTWQPDFSDPLYYKYWSALITEAGERYDGNPDLESVDISTVGYWGEGWSDYMPEFAVQRKLIDVYFDAFKVTPLLMNFDEPQALAYGTSRGAGWRFDCLGDMRQPWSHMLDFYPEQIARAAVQEVWRSAPVSMETCGVPESWFRQGWDVKYILGEALRWHVSSLNVKSSAIPSAWKTDFEDFERKMGYRFSLRRAEWKRETHAGQSIGLKTWWVNEGVAPTYRRFVLAFRLHSSGRSVVMRTDADVRKWLPGDAVYDGPMFVPADLPSGEYTFSVAMLDPMTGAPAIRLSVEGRQNDGWYSLGQIQVKQ